MHRVGESAGQAVRAALAHQCLSCRADLPGYSRVLVRDRDCGDVGSAAGFESAYPRSPRIRALFGVAYRRTRALDQQHAQITIATLGDAQEDVAPAAGLLAWNQAKLGAQFTPASELPRVAYRRDQRGRDQRPDALDLDQTLAALILFEELPYPLLVALDAFIKELEPLHHLGQRLAEHTT